MSLPCKGCHGDRCTMCIHPKRMGWEHTVTMFAIAISSGLLVVAIYAFFGG